VIDPETARALTEQGKSLPASGVRKVLGRFEAGSFVTVADGDGRALARGVSNVSSSELSRIRGMTSADAARALGYPKSLAIVDRESLVLTKELHHDA